MTLKTVSLFVLAGALFSLSCAVHADQTNPKLDELFQSLATDIDASEASRLTDEIWSIWHQFDDSTVQGRFDHGLTLMRRGELDKATVEFGHVITMAPEFAEAWNKRATVHYMMGQNALSASDVKKTLELEPRHFGALSGLGLLYGQHGRLEAAIKAYEEALAVNPHLPNAKRNLLELKKELAQRSGDAA